MFRIFIIKIFISWHNPFNYGRWIDCLGECTEAADWLQHLPFGNAAFSILRQDLLGTGRRGTGSYIPFRDGSYKFWTCTPLMLYQIHRPLGLAFVISFAGWENCFCSIFRWTLICPSLSQSPDLLVFPATYPPPLPHIDRGTSLES